MANLGWLIYIPYLVINILIAIEIYKDASRLSTAGKTLFLFSPIMWSMITLVGGVVSIIAYWLFHYSSLGIRNSA